MEMSESEMSTAHNRPRNLKEGANWRGWGQPRARGSWGNAQGHGWPQDARSSDRTSDGATCAGQPGHNTGATRGVEHKGPEVASGSRPRSPKLDAVPGEHIFDGTAGTATNTCGLAGTNTCSICGAGYAFASCLAYFKDPERTDLYTHVRRGQRLHAGSSRAEGDLR